MTVIFDVRTYLLRYSFCTLLLIICELPIGLQTIQEQVSNCQFNISTEDGTYFYDLNSLSRQSWKTIFPGGSGDGLKYVFISLCGNVQDHPCSNAQAITCIRKLEDGHWDDIISNAGSIIQTRDFNRIPHSHNGSWILELTGGQQCEQLNYTTQINFLCSEGIGEPVVEHGDNCRLVLNWATSAACPVSTQSCLVSLPHNSGSFNLWPLRHELYYTVPTSNGRVFRINVCDEVQRGHCGNNISAAVAACEIDPRTNNTIAILGLAGRQSLVYSEKGLLLTYKAQNKKITTEIEFVCNPSIQYGEPKFKWENNKTYYFEMETSLSCITSDKVDCTVYDQQGYKYDLSELTKSRGNWLISDPRPGYKDVKYHINVCRPLSVLSDCAGGTVSACQTIAKEDTAQTSISLGVLGNGPQIVGNENQLVIHYNGGAPCQNGKFRRRTVILFECSRKEESPVFENESPDCVFSFRWSHPAACSKKFVVGESCMVQEPEYSHVFNVSAIYNPHKDYEMLFDDGNNFRINLCGPLLKPCNGQKNISVCLEKSGRQFAIGELATKLLYEEGRVSFKLAGQGCKAGQNSSTVYIIFLCKHGVKNTVPERFPSDDNCNFFIVWQSSLTCPPYRELSCHTVDNENQEYDLSTLSDPSGNYIVLHKTSYGHVKFLLNVCRSVVFGHEATCEYSSGVCLYNRSATNNQDSYINLGDVTDGLRYEHGMLQITYSQGDVCRSQDYPGHMSSKIVFVCDHDKSNNTGPQFMKFDKCQYHFEWHTIHACPVTSMVSQERLNQSACTVTSPITKFRFDLNSLTKEEYTAKSSNGDTFKIAVCGSLKNCGLGGGVGIGSCHEKNGKFTNAGVANSEINIRTGAVFLNYSHGEECVPGIKSNTLIEFVCSPQNTTNGPQYVDTTSNCSYVIHWFTKHACDNSIRCMAQGDDKQIDLSPFMNTSKNYKASNNGSVFFINVCHPLLPVEGLNCAGGSGACMAQAGPNSVWTEERSLGFPIITPVISEGNVILKYIFGSPCHRNEGLNISSSFNFTCDPTAGLGNPVFQAFTHDCQYQFVWKSRVICDDYESEPQNSCILHNNRDNQTVDLTSLYKEEGYKIQSYKLRMCNTGIVASLSQHIEGKELSYGNVQHFVFSYKENIIKLIFSEGDNCTFESKSDTYKAEMKLRCDKDAVNQVPRISTVQPCKVILEWITSAACINVGAGRLSDDSLDIHTGTVVHVSPVGVVIGLLIILILMGILAVCLRKPSNRSRCKNHLCCLFRKQHHGQFHYSRLKATDEASHLDGVESDSDDELLTQ